MTLTPDSSNSAYFLFRMIWNADRKKYDKKPSTIQGQWPASPRENLVSREIAERALAALPDGEYALGLWLEADSGLFFIDLDECVNADGHLIDDAARIAEPFVTAGAYFETSSSGRGVHIIGRYSGVLPAHCNRRDKFEFYIADRGVALNPRASRGSMSVDCSTQLSAMLPIAFPSRNSTSPVLNQFSGPRSDWRGPSDDNELIRRAMASPGSVSARFAGKATFIQLWSGTVEHNSESDMALAAHLAFWTGCDAERIERLMRRSGLVRDKWDTHKTYLRERTIALACASTKNVYQESGNLRTTPSISNGVEPCVEMIRGDTIKPESVDWLWNGWLAAGKLHLIAGQPGTGKTTIAMAFAGIVTVGGRWPDHTLAERGTVVIWSGEDDIADTLAPRLLAAGADMSGIHVVNGVRVNGQHRSFDPANDVEALERALDDLPNVRLIIVDPIVSAVSGDSHKNAEVRRGLQPLVDLARRYHSALLGVTHFTKGTSGRDPTERVTGSLAFGALARLVMVTAKQDKNDNAPPRRILARAKSNIGADGGGFVYELHQGELESHRNVVTTSVSWQESLDGTARELLEVAESHPTGQSHDAADFLRQLLADGINTAKEIYRNAEAAGYSRDAMKRAMRHIGAKAIKQGFSRGWSWHVPNAAGPEGSEESTRIISLPSPPSVPVRPTIPTIPLATPPRPSSLATTGS